MAYQTQKRSRFRWSYAFIILTALVLVGYGMVAAVSETGAGGASAAVIPVTGTVTMGGDQFSRGTTPDQIEQLTEDALRSPAVEAVVYRVNSGGGGAVASKKTAEIIRDVEKPTVCVMEQAAASGGLWIATACDKVVADSLTITGSIGVTSSYLEVSDLLEQFNVTYVNLTSAEFKEMGSRYRELSPEERELFQETLQDVHNAFVEAVAENRNLSMEQVENVADGRVFLGEDAKQYGLVDRLGGKEEALQLAEEMTGKQLEEKTIRRRKPFNLLEQLTAQIGYGFAQGLKQVDRKAVEAAWKP